MSDRLDEIRQRWAAATPGPWRQQIAACDHVDQEEHAAIKGGGALVITCVESHTDAAAIAAAPADVAWLVGEVERLQARVDELAAVLAEPDADEQIRIGRIVARFYQGPPPVGDGSWMLAVARAFLADLRKRAGAPSTAGGGSPLLPPEGAGAWTPERDAARRRRRARRVSSEVP